jgi:hypothetical protein
MTPMTPMTPMASDFESVDFDNANIVPAESLWTFWAAAGWNQV